MNDDRNPLQNVRPVIENETGEDRGNQAGKKSFYKPPSFGYFFSMFCGCLIGSLIGTGFVQFLMYLL